MSSLKALAEDILLLDRLQDNGVPTASIAVLQDGKLEPHVLTPGAENSETVYQAASISKAICALGVAKLVDGGKVSYDTRVVDHLRSGLVDTIVGTSKTALGMMQQVTVKMLLSHTSGLSQHGFPGYGRDAIPSAEQIIGGKHPANTPRMRFISPPGSQCSYSGGGFVILQMMLEEILGKPFSEIMHETVFKPLEMTRSWYGDLNPGESNFARAHFTAHTPAETERGYNILPELAAAGLWTTPSDLLKAVAAIQESLYTKSGFLTQETARLMLRKVASSESLGTVGLGWWVNDAGFGHGGDNWPGYNATLVGFHGGATSSRSVDGAEMPRDGIAIMTNSILGHATCVKQILGAIMYSQSWKGSAGKGEVWLPNARDKFIPYPAAASTAVNESWKTWMGKWEEGWEISEHDDGGPALRYGNYPAMKLLPAAAPVNEFEGGRKEVWLVVDGLTIGARLTWGDEGKGEQVVKLLLEDMKVLKRAA